MSKNKIIKNLFLSIFAFAILVLELLPNGVVLNFANPEGEPWRRTYSYFSLIPFGYANFGPFITAVLTCVLIVLILTCWFKFSKKLNVAIKSLSGVAIVTSLFPLMFGADNVTIIGVVITILLASIFGICFINFRENL